MSHWYTEPGKCWSEDVRILPCEPGAGSSEGVTTRSGVYWKRCKNGTRNASQQEMPFAGLTRTGPEWKNGTVYCW